MYRAQAEPLHLFILRVWRRQRLGSGLRDGSPEREQSQANL